ncbi:betaine/proline/choline family ABC transporter ATP-binding protein [Streptomyces californicus]
MPETETEAVRVADVGAASGASIQLENLTKSYPGNPNPAVENVSMDIRAGETVLLSARPAAGSPHRR